jgi:hypothetical protein
MGDDTYSDLGTVMSWVAGSVLGAAAVLSYQHMTEKPKIPRGTAVSQGYVDPFKLEVLVQDLDNNGTNRTLVKYDNKTYLLMAENGKPVAKQYQIVVEEGKK